MESLARHANYAEQRDVGVAWEDEVPLYLTGPQRRRWKHKQNSPKTHSHTPVQRCEQCKPAPKPRTPEPAPFRPGPEVKL